MLWRLQHQGGAVWPNIKFSLLKSTWEALRCKPKEVKVIKLMQRKESKSGLGDLWSRRDIGDTLCESWTFDTAITLHTHTSKTHYDLLCHTPCACVFWCNNILGGSVCGDDNKITGHVDAYIEQLFYVSCRVHALCKIQNISQNYYNPKLLVDPLILTLV